MTYSLKRPILKAYGVRLTACRCNVCATKRVDKKGPQASSRPKSRGGTPVEGTQNIAANRVQCLRDHVVFCSYLPCSHR
jgi:hypothetical protein